MGWDLVLLAWLCVSGTGEISLLCWVSWVLGADASEVGAGDMYVYPSDGEKFGSVEAVFKNFVRYVTVDSCTFSSTSQVSWCPRHTILLPSTLPTEGAIYTFSPTTK